MNNEQLGGDFGFFVAVDAVGGFAELAGVGVEADVGADADKAADGFDGEHQ